jgi:hypothetical protein
MLRSGDILHLGLSNIYQFRANPVAPPPAGDVNDCDICLNALAAVRHSSVTASSFPGLKCSGAQNSFEFRLPSGKITFGWFNQYAIVVDWK